LEISSKVIHFVYFIKSLINNKILGDDVLIHAGASGVGLSAIQLAKRAGA
jgi:NADPH:quinone reductase-like Zn-dependent oxidoreductase